MYDRRLNGQVLSFGHAGILYKKSFVMYDRQTESLWVHVTGKAEVGPLSGQQLRFMPATITTWENWKTAYPHTTVLPGYRRGGFMGTYTGTNRPQRFGLAVVVDFKAKLYSFENIQQHGIVNDHFRQVALVVAYFPKTNTATAWRRQLADRLLTFTASGQVDARGNPLLQDEQNGSLWSGMTGTAVSGMLQGQRLEQLSHNPILIDRFHAFYPEGEVFAR